MHFGHADMSAMQNQRLRWQQLTTRQIQLGLVVIAGLSIGLAVIVSTYYADNVKLLIGLVGGFVFVLLTMRWPELGILCFTALLSGLISLSWLPALRLGPISIQISDAMLMLLLGLVFLRATTQPGFKLFGSPLTVPLLLFVGAMLLAAGNSILEYGVNANTVLRIVRVLSAWLVFIPTFQLIRDRQSLRRFLAGLLILTVILLIGVIFPNRFEPLMPVEQRVAATGTETYSGFTRIYYSGDIVLYFMVLVTVASLATISKGNPVWRIALLSLLAYWAFRTLFRNYWLTLFFAAILLLVFLSSRERNRLLRHLIPVAAVGLLFLVASIMVQPAKVERISYVVTDRLGSLLHDPLEREGSLQWRAFETRYALLQFKRHPLLGHGLANSYRPPMVDESSVMYTGWASRYVENGYLYIAVMMGMLGLVPFLWLCATYLLRFFRNHHRIWDEGLRAVYLGFGLAFLGMLICNVVVPTFVFGPRLIFFPVAMGISEAILRLESTKKS